jgi:hypothetical protein
MRSCIALVCMSFPEARRSAGTDKLCRVNSEPKESSAAYYDKLVEILGVMKAFKAIFALILQGSICKAERLSLAGSPATMVLLPCMLKMTLARYLTLLLPGSQSALGTGAICMIRSCSVRLERRS